MRDFHDAKAMAHTLREMLSGKQINLTHSETLEVVSKMLGFADWNTLSAYISADPSDPAQPNRSTKVSATLPALPIKDTVPFPGAQLPLWIRRPKTVEAVRHACSNGRELVLVAQRSPDVEEPTALDVFDVGVLGWVLDIGPPSEEAVAHSPELAGSTQVLVQTQSRVAIRNFSDDAGRYKADIERIEEPATSGTSDLIERAAAEFANYASERQITVPKMWPPLGKLHDAGRVADLIAQRLPLPLERKQEVLATLNPVVRLEHVIAGMAA